MGWPIARNLAHAGLDVTAWNRTRAKAESLEAHGVRLADTPSDAVADATVMITMLTDAKAVESAMRSAAPALRPGTIWAQMSTVGVGACADFASWSSTYGLVYVDAPVQGSREPAERAQLIIMAAGPQEVRPELQFIFDAIGKRTIWVGDDAARGTASRLKLALNHYVFSMTHATAEALDLAKKLGVDPAIVVDVVTGGPLDSGYFQMKSRAILANDFAPTFSILNAQKDAALIAEAARDAGMKADLAEASLRRFARAVALGQGDKDIAASVLAD
jgi:3-hydroxyisobutyrate dehydrogenase